MQTMTIVTMLVSFFRQKNVRNIIFVVRSCIDISLSGCERVVRLVLTIIDERGRV